MSVMSSWQAELSMLKNFTDSFTLLISYFTENAMGSTLERGHWLVRRTLAFEREEMKQTLISKNHFIVIIHRVLLLLQTKKYRYLLQMKNITTLKH